MHNPKEMNGVVSAPPTSFPNNIRAPEHVVGEDVGDGTELNLELSVNIGPRRERPAMDQNPKPARIHAWGADLKLDIGRKVEGSSKTNTLAAPHASMNVAGVNPSDGNRKRGREIVESTEITKPFPIEYCNGVGGILYKNVDKNNIIIVCLCHVEFHTPTQFIRHTGGGGVPFPLRCIKVRGFKAPGLQSDPFGNQEQNIAT